MTEIQKTVNPFLNNFKLKVGELYKEQILVPKESIDFESKAILGYEKTTKMFRVESQKHVKLYEVPYNHKFFFKEFLSVTRDVFLYILLKLQENEDHIRLYYKVVCEDINISSKSFYNAISQLKEFSVICDKAKNEYWINPYYMFKGNRLDYFHKKGEEYIEVEYRQKLPL